MDTERLRAGLLQDATIRAYLDAGLPREPVEAMTEQVRMRTSRLLAGGHRAAALELAIKIGEQALAEVQAQRRHDAASAAPAGTKLPLLPAVACAAGCASCCRLRVEVNALEAERLFERARELGLLEATRGLAERVGGLSKVERLRARTNCVFLDEGGACRAHAVRPLACRAANSFDRVACDVSVENASVDAPIPVDAVWLVLLRAARVGLLLACEEQGVSRGLEELHAAIVRCADAVNDGAEVGA